MSVALGLSADSEALQKLQHTTLTLWDRVQVVSRAPDQFELRSLKSRHGTLWFRARSRRRSTSEIHATVVIDSSVEKVLEFIEDPENFARSVPSADRAVEVRRSGQHVGSSFRLIYRLFGMPFNEEFRVIRFEAPRAYTPHRRFQMWQTLRGCVQGTFTWTLEAEGNQTYASLDAAYAVMGGFLGRAVDAMLVHRALERDVAQMLENMKWLIVR